MLRRRVSALRERTVGQLTIDDERSFRHVAEYADLKEVLERDRYPFRVLPGKYEGRWDRALLLNLTYWGGAGGDLLESDRIPADVVAHAAWHHLAARALVVKPGAAQIAEALVLGESIASAFDVYLVGRLIGHSPKSSFLATQVAAMAETSRAAGLNERGFAVLLRDVADAPESAFADLRSLLYDATLALLSCRGADEALAALARFDGHRFAPLLHHYELSNWVLYARAHARAGRSADGARQLARVRAIDASLRARRGALAWLVAAWVDEALA
jgi:hypothetical protein